MQQAPLRRRRPALSCIECRRRKIKCDRTQPCQHCLSTHTQCAYRVYSGGQGASRRPISSTSPSTNATSPVDLGQVTDTARHEPTIVTRHQHHQDVSTVREPSTAEPPSATKPINPQRPSADIDSLLRRIARLEEAAIRVPESNPDLSLHQSALKDAQISLNKSRVLRWSNWEGIGEEYGAIMACFSEAVGKGDGKMFQEPQTKALVAEMGEQLRTCKDIARSIKQLTRPTRSLWNPNFVLEPPSRELADEAVDIYFNSFERIFRILHRPSFRTEYQGYWDNPDSARPALRLKILLVIGLGLSLRKAERDDGSRLDQSIYQWTYAAQSWLSGPLEKDRLEIPGIQIYCLTIVLRQVLSIGGDLVWMSMGDLMHRAMQIGLHRDPKHLPDMPVLQAELRRRLWATICELLVQSSLVAGMPPRVSVGEFDTAPPANVNDADVTETTVELRPLHRTSVTETSVQLILLESLPTRLRSLNILYGIQPELSYSEVLETSSEITEAVRRSSRFAKENPQTLSSFEEHMLDYLVRRFLIPLHMPFAFQAKSNPLFQHSLTISLDVALATVSLDENDAFHVLMTRGGGIFRQGFHLSLSITCLELLHQVEEKRLDGTLQRSKQYIDLLKGVVDKLVTLSAERVQQGETNVKGYMFLKMLMAQVEAIETDGPCEFMVAKSGRDSLRYCIELVRARADAVYATPSDSGLASMGVETAQEEYGLDLNWELFLSDHDFC